jgi:hypothetical protein
MNTRRAFYMQAIRGPVLLVTIGVLFAIHQAGVLSFSRTWPLLIIVIGVMKLLERAWAPPVPWPGSVPGGPPPPGGYNPTSQSYPSNQPYSSSVPPQGPGGNTI